MEIIATTAPMATRSRGRILFADDDEHIRASLGKCLLRFGFESDLAATGDEAIELLRTRTYDVLLSDVNMPGNCALELIENTPAIIEGLPVILLTGSPTVETAMRSVGLHILAYLAKPPDLDELCRLLDSAVAGRRELGLLKDSRQRLQNWEHEIERIQRLLQQSAPADRQATMQSYVRLTLRNLVVGLIDLEHLLVDDGGRLAVDQAVEKQEWQNALRKTVGVLQKTRDHFKSKELGELRKELETLLAGSKVV
ncbi:MAG: response regulator [Verrucomicrobiae bacterium]|nr:response regulator [Verrucomicrobiae bacterium]